MLDLHLSDISGEGVLRHLHEDPLTRDIPVVVSADATPPRIQKLLNSGVETYLTKTIDVPQFLLVMDGNLKKATNKRNSSRDSSAGE